MTKLMFSVITDFDNKSLATEHSKAVKRALLQIQKDCFFKILSNSDMNELIPELIGSEEERAKFIRFL
jgi:predicted component of type VI protein secretion system